MIPLITHTPRLLLLAASRALLTAELHKPHYLPTLLGAVVPPGWPPEGHDRPALLHFLTQLTAGGREAAGWYNWYALRNAEGDVPRTLVGAGGFLGPPDAAGTATIGCAVVAGWRGQGLGTELVAGLVQQAQATGRVRRLLAHPAPHNLPARRVLLANGFAPAGPHGQPAPRWERVVAPGSPAS